MTRRVRDPQRPARILAAAAALFYERGFHGVSVDEIGAAAGATGAAIYRHFASKEEILATLFDEAQDRYLLVLPEASGDPQRELEALIERTLALTLEQRELASIWAREDRALSAPYLRRLRRRERQYVERWVDCLARCFPERHHAELVTAARAAIGMITSLASRPDTASIRSSEIELVTAMIAAGLRALAPAHVPA